MDLHFMYVDIFIIIFIIIIKFYSFKFNLIKANLILFIKYLNLQDKNSIILE